MVYYPNNDNRPYNSFNFENDRYFNITIYTESSTLKILIEDVIYYYNVLSDSLYIGNEKIELSDIPLQEYLLRAFFDIENDY